MTDYLGIKGQYRPYQGRAEGILGRAFRALVDIEMAATLRHALVIGAIEQAIQEWVSCGKIKPWINWDALMSAQAKTKVLD